MRIPLKEQDSICPGASSVNSSHQANGHRGKSYHFSPSTAEGQGNIVPWDPQEDSQRANAVHGHLSSQSSLCTRHDHRPSFTDLLTALNLFVGQQLGWHTVIKLSPNEQYYKDKFLFGIENLVYCSLLYSSHCQLTLQHSEKYESVAELKNKNVALVNCVKSTINAKWGKIKQMAPQPIFFSLPSVIIGTRGCCLKGVSIGSSFQLYCTFCCSP